MTKAQQAQCERMWIAGRAYGLRLQGLSYVEASKQATWESQQYVAAESHD